MEINRDTVFTAIKGFKDNYHDGDDWEHVVKELKLGKDAQVCGKSPINCSSVYCHECVFRGTVRRNTGQVLEDNPDIIEIVELLC
jgi:hypothetical protein